MFDVGLVASGAAIGIAVAAPIGPVNLIVIRRALRWGSLYGFIAGLGAALGDGVFACIAAFGVTAAIDFVVSYQNILQFIGGLFLVFLGIRTFLDHPHLDNDDQPGLSVATARVFASTFILTVTNPATMLGFIAIFGGIAGLTASGQKDYLDALTLSLSVVLGSALWWAGLAYFVSLFRQRMGDRLLEIVNHVSGVLITLFGLIVLGHAIYRIWL